MSQRKTEPKKADSPVLGASELTCFEVEYRDLESFFIAVYGNEFEFVSDQEGRNDSYHLFFVDGKLNRSDAADVKRFKRTGASHGYLTSKLLNDCCKHGLIKSGHYLVYVSW